MMRTKSSSWLTRLGRLMAMVWCSSLLFFVASSSAVYADGVTWYVDRAGDSVSDGDLATRRGTLRFALAHADSGDFVSFQEFDLIAERIFVSAPLIVPDGVSVGHTRSDPCGSYMQADYYLSRKWAPEYVESWIPR